MKLKRLICLTLSLLMMSACFAALPAFAVDGETAPEYMPDVWLDLTNPTPGTGANASTITYDEDYNCVVTRANDWARVAFDVPDISSDDYKYMVVEAWYSDFKDADSTATIGIITYSDTSTGNVKAYKTSAGTDYYYKDSDEKQWLTLYFPLDTSKTGKNIQSITFQPWGGSNAAPDGAYVKYRSIRFTADKPMEEIDLISKGIYDQSTNGAPTETTFEGISVKKLVAQSTGQVSFNTHPNNFGAGIDLSKYHYIVMEYYIKNENVDTPVGKVRFRSTAYESDGTSLGGQCYSYAGLEANNYEVTSDTATKYQQKMNAWNTVIIPINTMFIDNQYKYLSEGELAYINVYPAGDLMDTSTVVYIKSMKAVASVEEYKNINCAGAQVAAGSASNTNKLRFLATLGEASLTDYAKVGYVINAKLGSETRTWDRSGTSVYSSVQANQKAVSAASLGGSYIVALELDGVPTNAQITFEVTPYVVKDGDTVYGSTVTFLFENGELVNSFSVAE